MIFELIRKQRPLMAAGVISFIGFVVMAVLTQVDSTLILGVNRWIKPGKFFISVAIFVWTIAVYLYFLKGQERFGRRISRALIAVFVIELTAVTGQAARGTTSHFNVATPFDVAIFSIMGIAILISTILTGAVLYRYLRTDVDLSTTMVAAMRFGLVIFLFGSVIGGYISVQTGHTVGAPDGGPGLPLTNWSSVAGDLRIAHFLGLHALQAVPLLALIVDRMRLGSARVLTIGFALAYFAIVAAALVQALLGKPLISI